MNLNMIQPKNETEDLLLSITKNCETPTEQTHKKSETLEFKMAKSRETFQFNPPILIQGSWMIAITNLEICNSLFVITQKDNKFQLYTGYLEGEVSYTQLKDKVAEVLGLSNLT